MKIRIIDNIYTEHGELFRRKLSERIPVEYAVDGMTIELNIDESIGAAESYLIGGVGDNWTITGADKLGLYFGIGKFLHTAKWTEEDFVPCPPKKVVTPNGYYRVINSVSHFYNWYQMASIEELQQYIEELTLWGYNQLGYGIPVINLESYEDPIYYECLKKAKMVWAIAKKLGLKLGAGLCPNQGVKWSPHEYDADPSFDPLGNVRGHLGRNLCPAKPGVLEHLREIWRRTLQEYKDAGFEIDSFLFWPYDEGGCGCETCRPWGAKGFLDLCIECRKDVLEFFPNAEMIVATWIYDKPHDQGEYEGLYKRLKGDMAWVDYLMIDAHGEFPRYPLEHEVIKPIVNFPEISMWKLYPWGGFGASPLPKRFQGFWDEVKHIVKGGKPYSEGLYEDISKVQCVGYYWEPERHYRDILGEYINYEYSKDVVDEVLELMELIEENHVLAFEDKPNLEVAIRAANIAEEVNEKLGERAKKAWRWRILYIRAMLDKKRYQYFEDNHMGGVDDLYDLRHWSGDFLIHDFEAQDMFRELRKIYHAVDYNGENQYTLPPVNGGCVLNNMTYAERLRERYFKNGGN